MPYKDKTKRHSKPISNCTFICPVCHKFFHPYRLKQIACSAICRNSLTSKKTAEVRAATQRNRGEGKSYRKFQGRHEHRVIAEQKLGRPLLPGEIVHHIDHDKRNNNPENLEVLPSQAEHCRLHFKKSTRSVL